MLPENSAPAVHIDTLVKRFGTFVAVDHVSIDVRRGEIFGFLGPNGAGITPFAFERIVPSLEDVFIAFSRKQEEAQRAA